MNRAYFLVVCLVLACCRTTSSSSSGDPDPVIRVQPGKELCGQACEVMRNKLVNADGGVGCEEGQIIPSAPGQGDIPCFDGGPANDCVSCESFCVYQHENGTFWNNNCIIESITTCEQIETVCNTQ